MLVTRIVQLVLVAGAVILVIGCVLDARRHRRAGR